MRRVLLGVLLVAALFGAACGRDEATTQPGNDGLDGRVFLSRALEGHTLVSGTQIRLSFDGNNLGANAGCNSLSANYSLNDDVLVVPDTGMATTDMGCDPARHAQDEWLATFFQSEPAVRIAGNDLTLTNAEATLHLLDRRVADPDRPLVATRWQVDTIVQGDAASSVPSGAPVTLVFGADGTLTATSADCTSALVPVQIDEEKRTVRFADFAIDDIGCPSPWNATITVLRSGTASYSINASRLTIQAGDNGIGAVSAE